MNHADRIHIGTSGWHYNHWKGPFYPEGLASGRFLDHYCRHFLTVEINNSFYRLPSEESVRNWYESVPKGFIFAVKASRYITHVKKLKDPAETLPPFFSRIELLQDKLGPILFQLPPSWKINLGRLKAFLQELPGEYLYAFELRNATWFDSSIYEILSEFHAAFCIYHLSGVLSPKEVTAPHVYVRLHGPGSAYQGQYDRSILEEWAGAFSAWTEQGKEVYCYFDNDEAAHAPRDALRLKAMVEG